MTARYGDVKDTFGQGGANIPPGGGGGSPSMRDVVRALLGSIGASYANVAGLQASLATNRVDGQLAIKLDDYTLWVWNATSATAADASHIAPTDLAGGAGRWMPVQADIQAGRGVLVNGVSAAIAANISPTSRIFVNRALKNASTAYGFLNVLDADRVTGTPGSFIVRAHDATTAAVATDQSSFDWIVIG